MTIAKQRRVTRVAALVGVALALVAVVVLRDRIRGLFLHDVERFVELRRFGSHAWSVAFSADGRRLASGGRASPPVTVWDVASGEAIRDLDVPEAHEGAIHVELGNASSGDGSTVTARFKFAGTHRWKVDTGERLPVAESEVEKIEAHEALDLDTVARHGRHLARANAGAIVIEDTRTGAVLRTLRHTDGIVSSLAFSPDGEILASASAGAVDGARDVKLWEIATGQELRTLPWHGALVFAVAFSPDGDRLAIGGEGGIAIWGLRER